MILYAVVLYRPLKMMGLWIPYYLYISENKEKSEKYLKELKEKDNIFNSMYEIIEIETETDLKKLSRQEIW